ncbi:MAG: alpha/beta fold hydrolase [Deltaproteobacteria bacterium]|nr:alpha/beta fold hydrolase [Deltaproteobacteria bacterium]
MLSLLHPGAAQRAARKRVPKARVVVERALRDREALSKIRMALSLMSEAHNLAKNTLDHAVRMAEKVYFGQDYLDSRLAAYRGQKRAVFLYHGYLQGRPAFERFERLLDSALFDLFPIAAGYQPYSQDLRISAEYERRVIDRVLAATDLEEIYLVGHSQGGIIARYLLQELAAPKVKRCVFLATPHRGTYAGLVGYPHRVATFCLSALPAFPNVSGESGLQLLPGSRFLDRLNSLDLPAGVEYTSIYNYIDPLLVPARYGRMPYPQAHNILMMKIGHYHALYDQQETEIVLRALVLGQSVFADFRKNILGGQELLDAAEFGAKATSDVFVAAAD